jgi:hypothetical protein
MDKNIVPRSSEKGVLLEARGLKLKRLLKLIKKKNIYQVEQEIPIYLDEPF